MLKTESALTHDTDLKLQAALAQHTADANQRTDVSALRAENLQLLGQPSTVTKHERQPTRRPRADGELASGPRRLHYHSAASLPQRRPLHSRRAGRPCSPRGAGGGNL